MKTQTKRTPRKNVPEKYFKLLVEIYNHKILNERFEMQEYLKTNKLSRGLPLALSELKLLQKTGYNKWIWIAGRPTMQMALDAIEVLRLKSEKYNPNNVVIANPFKENALVKKQIKKPAVKIEMPVKKTGIKLSLFWGMFNFQKN